MRKRFSSLLMCLYQDTVIYLFFSVGLADKSDDVVVAAWIKITSDNKFCLLERKVFSSFPENGLKSRQNDKTINKLAMSCLTSTYNH